MAIGRPKREAGAFCTSQGSGVLGSQFINPENIFSRRLQTRDHSDAVTIRRDSDVICWKQERSEEIQRFFLGFGVVPPNERHHQQERKNAGDYPRQEISRSISGRFRGKNAVLRTILGNPFQFVGTIFCVLPTVFKIFGETATKDMFARSRRKRFERADGQDPFQGWQMRR